MEPLEAMRHSKNFVWRAAYLRTTTIGDSVLHTSPSPFQIMSPVVSTDAKFST